MRSLNLTFGAVSTILVCFLAVSQSGVINEPLGQVESYSFIDPIIKAILEGLRPKLANLAINDINESVVNPNLNATVLVNDILIQNLDKFQIQTLKSNLVPLKLTNLTLTWANVVASASYDVNAIIGLPQINGPINLFGKGVAKAVLKDLFFTTGANVEMKDLKIQIKPKGLFGFDLKIGSANVTISSLMGSSDLGKALGVFISQIIPDLVDTLKKPLFDTFQDDIINIVNQILKKNGTLFLDEESSPFQLSSESFENLDLSEEISAFLRQPFNLGLKNIDSDSEF